MLQSVGIEKPENTCRCELRSKVANLFSRPRKIESNLSKDKLKALDELTDHKKGTVNSVKIQ